MKTVEQPKKQTAERDFKVIHFPEKSKLELNLEQSVSDLVDAMRELKELGRMTGREGLPERVYLAFTSVLLGATSLAKAEDRERLHGTTSE